MPSRRSPLVIIVVTIIIDLIGFGIVIPVLPLYAIQFKATMTEVGLLLSSFSAMQFIFSPILGRLSDRVGRRPVLLFSLIGTSIGFLIMGFAGALWMLFLGRILDGISGGNISTAQAYIADITPPEERSRGMGLIGAAFGIGFTIGPAIGGLLSQISMGAPFLFAAGLAAANAVALFFLLPESLSRKQRLKARQPVPVAVLFRESGNWNLAGIMAMYFFATIAFSLLTATYALFTNRRFGFDAAHNGYVFAYLGMLGVLIQGGLLGRLLSAFGERSLAISGAALMALSLFSLPLAPGVTLLLIISTGVAVGNSLFNPVVNGLVSRSVRSEWQGKALGILQSSASLARIIGPAMGGWLLDLDLRAGVEAYGQTPYWAGAASLAVALALAIVVQSPGHRKATVKLQNEVGG